MIHCDFKTMHMPCALTCEAYCPAQSVLPSRRRVCPFFWPEQGEEPRLQRLEDRVLQTLYEHRVMFFQYREQISKHLPFWDLQKKLNLTVSGGIKTLDMIKCNNLPDICQSLTLSPQFLCLQNGFLTSLRF